MFGKFFGIIRVSLLPLETTVQSNAVVEIRMNNMLFCVIWYVYLWILLLLKSDETRYRAGRFSYF